MLKVVWVLWPLTFAPVKIIFVLVVVILYLLRVGIINQWFVKINTGFLIHYFRGGMIILVLLVMVEVGLVLGPPTSTPRKLVLAETGIMGGLFHIRVIAHNTPF